MALQKQLVPIPLEGGLDTKTDKKRLVVGKSFLLENAVRRKLGRYEKRYGCQSFGADYVGGSSPLVDADALGVFNQELLQYNKQSVYAYSEKANKWTDKGAVLSCRVRLQDLVKNSYQQTQVDMAVLNDIAFLTWEDSRGGIRCSVYDIVSGSQLMSDVQVSASGTRPRCAALGNTLMVFYQVSGDIRAKSINPLDPSALSAESTLSSLANTSSPQMDVCVQNDYILVAFNGSGTNLYLQRVSEALGVLQTINITESASNTIGVIRGPTSRTFLFWHTGTDLRCSIYDVLGTQQVAPFTVEALTGIEAVTAYALPDDSGVRVFYQVDAAQTYNHYVKTALITNAGSVSGVAVLLRSVGLASKAWAYSPNTTDRGFVTVVHDSTLQSTFFTIRNDGLVVAKIGAGLAGGLTARGQLSTVSRRSEGVYTAAFLTKNPVIAAGDTTFLTFKGVSIAEVDFSDQTNFSSVQLGENSHILGGVLQTYDGQSVVEHGFHLYPENISPSQTTGGSLTLLGAYQYQVIYQWTDAKGQIHRSSPSAPISITLTGSNNRVVLNIPTLRITSKQGVRTNAEIVVFRTQANLTALYRASSPTSPTYNDPTSDSINFTDDLDDATLIGREPLYTTGDVIPNDAPPSSAFGCTWKNRLVLGGTEDDSLWISKEREQSKPVEFSVDLVVLLDPIGGRLTAVSEFGDKLIIFKESAIYYIYGEGPDSQGVGQWSVPESISQEIGCIDSNSVSETPGGVVFKSRKGIYLLTADGGLNYIGDRVEDWNGETITAANVLADQDELRFSTLNGPTLVYNYYSNEWSVFPDTAATDAIIWQQQFVYIRKGATANSESLVVKEVPGFYQDIDKYYSMKIGIGSISFAGLAGFQRIMRLLGLGEYKSQHQLRIKLAFNNSDNFTEEHIWDATTYLGASTYGESDLYGDDEVYGGIDQPYLVRIHLAQQKSTALRVIFEDIQIGGSGESFNLTSLSAETGIKRGGFKLPSEASR